MTYTETPQPTNWTFGKKGVGRYETKCPACNTRMVAYHRDAPTNRMTDRNEAGIFNCGMCDSKLYVNRVCDANGNPMKII